MGLEEARDTLAYHNWRLQMEQCEDYSSDKQRFIEALDFAIDRLDKEIASYRNI